MVKTIKPLIKYLERERKETIKELAKIEKEGDTGYRIGYLRGKLVAFANMSEKLDE